MGQGWENATCANDAHQKLVVGPTMGQKTDVAIWQIFNSKFYNNDDRLPSVI